MPGEQILPCSLQETSYANATPPVISRVCRESRSVAFETGEYVESFEDIPKDKRWLALNDWGSERHEPRWRDRARDMIAFNYYPGFDACWGSPPGDPKDFLEWHRAKMEDGRCALRLDFVEYGAVSYESPRLPHDNQWKVLLQMPKCFVVMCCIVIHSDFKSAALTGLFGLLGDARVQVVDAAEKKRVETFMDWAERNERQHNAKPHQRFNRAPLEILNGVLKRQLLRQYASEELLGIMRPAYMFRLCTAKCNWTD